MPDFLRWIIAGVTSVVVAGLVFLLATVGIVVAFFVFLVLFVVVGLTMRRMRKNVQYGEDGSRFIIYTNITGVFGEARRHGPKGHRRPQETVAACLNSSFFLA